MLPAPNAAITNSGPVAEHHGNRRALGDTGGKQSSRRTAAPHARARSEGDPAVAEDQRLVVAVAPRDSAMKPPNVSFSRSTSRPRYPPATSPPLNARISLDEAPLDEVDTGSVSPAPYDRGRRHARVGRVDCCHRPPPGGTGCHERSHSAMAVQGDQGDVRSDATPWSANGRRAGVRFPPRPADVVETVSGPLPMPREHPREDGVSRSPGPRGQRATTSEQPSPRTNHLTMWLPVGHLDHPSPTVSRGTPAHRWGYKSVRRLVPTATNDL